ncbi:MAG: DMT family transporter [Theionarchaea archaeon]|nr:DMT family transporter [Theionarchaea archaeon]MBU7038552.1 DMT family transporter [Theionarchaea archaeon]
MSLMWVPLVTLTIVLYGAGQVFTKKGTSRLGSGGMLLLLSITMMAVYGGAWVLFAARTLVHFREVLYCSAAAILSSLGYIFFFEAVERQKISIVGVVTASYPFVTVILAVYFLHEPLTFLQILAVILVIAGVSLLSYEPTGQEMGSHPWLLMATLCVVMWGLSSLMTKVSITLVGPLTYAGIYAILGPSLWIPYWWMKGGRVHSIEFDRDAEISVIFFCLGSLLFYSAMSYGYVSIVTAFSNLYPFVTLVLARLIMAEMLHVHHYGAAALTLLGIVILALF